MDPIPSHSERPIGHMYRSQTLPITDVELESTVLADQTNQTNNQPSKHRRNRSSITQFLSVQPHDYSDSKQSARSINQPVDNVVDDEIKVTRIDYLAAESQTSRSLFEWLFRTLPSVFMPQPPRSSFARVTNTAMRSCLSFIIAACLACQDWSPMVFGIAYFFLINAGLFMNSTVGLSIQLSEMQVKATLVPCIIDTILISTTVASIENETHRIVAIELLLFVTTIGLCYFFTHPIQRRQSLVLHSLTMVAMAQGTQTQQYPAQLFAGFVCAALVTCIVVAIPFPRLAKDEILDRWSLSVQTLSRDFSKLTEAFLMRDQMRPRVLIALVRDDLTIVLDQIAAIRKLQPVTRYEASIWHLLFFRSIYFGSIVRADPDKLEAMFWVVSNLCDTIQQIENTSIDHKNMVKRAGSAFDSFQGLQAEYVKLLTNNAGDNLSINQLVHANHVKLTDAFHRLEDVFVEGRILNLQGIARRCRQMETNDPLVIQHANDELYNHNLVMFYCGRWFHHLHTMTVDPLITDTFNEQTNKPCTPLSRPLNQLQFSYVWTTHWNHPHDWTLLGMTPLKDLKNFFTSTWNFILHPSIDVTVLKSAVKIAWIICCASLFAVIPQINSLSVLPNAIWSVVTTSYLISANEGMLWNRCLQRLLGTTCGGLVGYLIVVAFPESYEGSISLLALWVFFTQLIAGFPRFQYFGLMNAFTAMVVVVGKRQSAVGQALSAGDYALARMIEISLGILVYLLFSSILWPVSSIRMLRSEMIVAIQACNSATAASSDIFSRIIKREKQIEKAQSIHTNSTTLDQATSEFLKENAHSVGGTVKLSSSSHDIEVIVSEADQDEMLRQLLHHSSSVGTSLGKQSIHLFDAITEPIAILIPVPETQYRTVMANIRHCWEVVLTIEPALRQVLAHQVEQAATHPTTCNDAIKRIGQFDSNLRVLIDHIRTLFALCTSMLVTGNPALTIEELKCETKLLNTGSSSADVIAASIKQLRTAQFDLTLRLANQFAEAEPDAHGPHAQILGLDSVPMTVFVHMTMKLCMEALILDLNIRRLLKLERPIYYDDR